MFEMSLKMIKLSAKIPHNKKFSSYTNINDYIENNIDFIEFFKDNPVYLNILFDVISVLWNTVDIIEGQTDNNLKIKTLTIVKKYQLCNFTAKMLKHLPEEKITEFFNKIGTKFYDSLDEAWEYLCKNLCLYIERYIGFNRFKERKIEINEYPSIDLKSTNKSNSKSDELEREKIFLTDSNIQISPEKYKKIIHDLLSAEDKEMCRNIKKNQYILNIQKNEFINIFQKFDDLYNSMVTFAKYNDDRLIKNISVFIENIAKIDKGDKYLNVILKNVPNIYDDFKKVTLKFPKLEDRLQETLNKILENKPVKNNNSEIFNPDAQLKFISNDE